MTAVRDLFPGLAERRINTGGAEISLRIAGSGPPLLPFIAAQGGA
jgi:hypothetical protein